MIGRTVSDRVAHFVSTDHPDTDTVYRFARLIVKRFREQWHYGVDSEKLFEYILVVVPCHLPENQKLDALYMALDVLEYIGYATVPTKGEWEALGMVYPTQSAFELPF